MSNTTAMLAKLQQHCGAGNGITAEALAAALDTTKRQVRLMISELRLEGTAICGHPKTGYFIAATREELQATIKFLRDRAVSSLEQATVLERAAIPELAGQERLRS